LVVGAALVLPPSSRAVDITLTMDDLPLQPVDGLVHPSGVQFGFTIGGLSHPDARYAAGGPGIGAFVQDPSIEGSTAGVLYLTFPTPTPILKFGLARNSLAEIPMGAVIELFDESNASLGLLNVPLLTLAPFAEGQFNYSGTPVKHATVDFRIDPNSIRFAFDNLVFRLVPEPGALLLSGMAVACAASLRVRRRAA
jgi:hypothetical protein